MTGRADVQPHTEPAEHLIAQDEAAKPPWLAEQERAEPMNHPPFETDALDASYKEPDDDGYVWGEQRNEDSVGLTPDADLYLMPETRCMRWGHVFVAHELLGSACARCGKAADPLDASEGSDLS